MLSYQANPELDLAYRFVQYTGKNIFLTGKAGTGKTTFLRNLREQSPKRMVVVAPTGVAAINAGGVTMHSMFQLPFGIYLPEYRHAPNSQQSKGFTSEKLNILRSIDLLVIDEISMVRADLLDSVDDILRRTRRTNQPFGGVQLLMIGDLQQLSPVAREEEWNILKLHYETPYFFSSHALRQTDYITIELKKVYRQSDEHFINLLNKIRENCVDGDCLNELNKRYDPAFAKGEHEGYITLTTHNAQAQQLNQSRLDKLKGASYTFNAAIDGDFPEHAYPTEPELTLKEGAQVMFVKNDPSPEKLFYNGKIGKVVEISDESVSVKCSDLPIPIEVTPLEWTNARYEIDSETKEIKEKIIGTFKQIPLRAAWAITIHKSQGLTFDKAIINANLSFAHGQVYVALSRCKSLEGLVLGTPLSHTSIINDGTVKQFSDEAERNAPNNDTLAQSKLQYGFQLLCDLFDFNNIQRLLFLLLKVIRESPGAMPDSVGSELGKQVDMVKNEVNIVAGKFKLQLQQLVNQHGAVEDCQAIQERIGKGSAYFTEKLQNLSMAIESIPTQTDNKQVRQQWSEYYKVLRTDLRVKLACLGKTKDSFDIAGYLDIRAKALLDEPKTERRVRSKVAVNAEHAELYAELRSWRHEKALELDVDEYLILQQKTLLELTDRQPATYAELKEVKGIGKKKLQQLGTAILEIIRSYRFRNDLPLPDLDASLDLDEKKKKEKVDTKRVSLELFKQGWTVDEIAAERGLTIGTIETHLAHFVETNEVDIYDLIPAEKLTAITRYFSENEVASLTQVKEALGDNFSWNEIRIAAKWVVKTNT